MSRLLVDLEPITREKVLRLIAASPLVLGRELFIVHTHRSYEEQDRIYAQGRTDEGRIVTNAKGGESWHNMTWADGTPVSHAIDFAFEERGTQHPTWANSTTEERKAWQLLGAMGKAIGFVWGGDFENLKDFGHFHRSGGDSIDKWRATYERGRNVEGS